MKSDMQLNADDHGLLAEFDSNGLLVLHDFFPSGHAIHLKELVCSLATQLGPESRILSRYDSGLDGRPPYLLKVENFSDGCPLVQQLVLQPTLSRLLEQLLASKPILFEDKCVYKPSGSTGFGAHQNMTRYGWGYFVKRTVTVLVALDHCNAENGRVEFALSEHRQGMIGTMLKKDGLDGLAYQGIDLTPGSLVIFDGYLPHRSMPNGSARDRCTLSLTFNGEADGDQRENYFTFRPRLERHLMLKRFHRRFVREQHNMGGAA